MGQIKEGLRNMRALLIQRHRKKYVFPFPKKKHNYKWESWNFNYIRSNLPKIEIKDITKTERL